MPITRAHPERTPHALRDAHLNDRGTALSRLNVQLTELHEMETGQTSPYFWAARRSEGTANEVANDAICLCNAIIRLLDDRYPQRG